MACKPMKFSLIFLKKWNPLVPGILEMESQDLSSLSFSDWIFSLEQCIALMLGQNSLNSQECFETQDKRRFFLLHVFCMSHQSNQRLLFHKMSHKTPMQQNPLELSSSLLYIIV